MNVQVLADPFGQLLWASLAGPRHVHPASQGPGFGPCPVHPDAPGDV